MNQKDFKNKESEMQIFLSYFKPHRKLFLLDMVCVSGNISNESHFRLFPGGVCTTAAG